MSRWQLDRLTGGLPLVQGHRPGVGLIAARLWIRGGSSLDPGGQRGAMQLLAGSMTRGCADLDAEQLAECVEGLGASLRCEALEDALVLSLKCASEDATTLLPLLLAMARQPRLDSAQVAIERELNLQTLQRQREDPFQQAHDQLRQLLYGDGPYGHDPLGVEEELSRLQPADLASLLPLLGERGALLVVCGDLPARDVLAERLNRELEQQPWHTALPQAAPLALSRAAPAFGGVPQDTEQVVVMLGSATVPLSDPDALPLRLLQAHFGLGMSSRLFILMREERGLAYDVGVHMPSRCGPSPFVWHLSTTADNLCEALTVLLDAWTSMLHTPLSDEALALALAKYRGQDALGRQTCSQVADRQALVLGHALGEDYVSRALREAEGLSPHQLLGAARRLLAAPSLSLCGPEAALAAAQRLWSDRHPAAHGALERR